MSKMNQEMSNSQLMSLNDNGFWFFIPDRDAWDHMKAEADLQRDIDYELMLDEIHLYEVGANYES